MKEVNCQLIICGDGNFMQQAQQLVKKNNLQDKIIFKGKIKPDELRTITQQAYIGITLFDDAGLSNYYSLANRFFDYLHAGIPQLCVNYPVYKEINDKHQIAILVDDISAKNLALQLNNLLDNEVVYKELQQNCLKAREELNWQQEEKKLIHFIKIYLDKHLHIVALDVPWPADYGGVVDLFYKLKALHQLGIKIHLHCFTQDRNPQEELNKYCVSVNYYQRKKNSSSFSLTLPLIVKSRQNKELIANLKKDNHPFY